MVKLIKNTWHRNNSDPFVISNILHHEIHPEGFDVTRMRFIENGRFAPKPGVGHLISIMGGHGILHSNHGDNRTLRLQTGVHLYLPPNQEFAISGEPELQILHVCSPSAAQARGEKMLIRDETFVSACALPSQPLRWTFTSQYLSRRIFLHHDKILLSKSGNPVSWFHTTMFDVSGLPKNQDGEPVFKMSYNSRTEFNVCYDVKGDARVRMAQHPYAGSNQLWSPWHALDGDSTYHLNEAAGGPEEESYLDKSTHETRFLRNKHEVYIKSGYVSLYCLFDPAPTGVENHHPGEYSDYEPLSRVLGSKAYEALKREIDRYDQMVDRLSLAKAMGELNAYSGTALWELYIQGRDAQTALEADLAKTMAAQGHWRDSVLARWMLPVAQKRQAV
jgi:hypothetical protein